MFVGFERSGVVRQAFRDAGHDAWSCDIEIPDDFSKFHLKGKVHPPCQYVCNSGIHWNKKNKERELLTERSLELIKWLWAIDKPMALENPPGVLTRVIGVPTQVVQPYQFGHNAAKRTCLWLKKLPLLAVPDEATWVKPRMVNGFKRWDNQLDCGNNYLGPSLDRAAIRAETYKGIAAAMVRSWSELS